MPRRIDEDIEKHDLETAAMEAQILAEAEGLPSEDGSPPVEPVPAPEAPVPAPEPVVEVVSTEPVPDPAPEVVPVPEPVLPPQPGVLSRLGKVNASPKPEAAVGDRDYQLLKHKVDSDIPKLHGWVKERDDTIGTLKQELEVSRRRLAELEDRVGTLTPAELHERYGLDEDGLDLLGGIDSTNTFRNVSGKVADERFAPFWDELQTVRMELASIRSEEAKRRITQFETQTKRDHPELESPEFMDWLDQNPSRIERFSAAFGAGDVESLVGEHTLFQALRGNVPSPTSLEAQAMPGQSATPSALGASLQPKQYTLDDVVRLNNKFDHEAGGMTPEDRAILEREIDAAESFVAQHV